MQQLGNIQVWKRQLLFYGSLDSVGASVNIAVNVLSRLCSSNAICFVSIHSHWCQMYFWNRVFVHLQAWSQIVRWEQIYKLYGELLRFNVAIYNQLLPVVANPQGNGNSYKLSLLLVVVQKWKEHYFPSGKDLIPLSAVSLFSTYGNAKLLTEFIRNQIFIELGPRHGADALILPLVDLSLFYRSEKCVRQDYGLLCLFMHIVPVVVVVHY